jgi:hypothetical protein
MPDPSLYSLFSEEGQAVALPLDGRDLTIAAEDVCKVARFSRN